MSKTFVGITATHDVKGNTTPNILHWPDGRQWPIDKVLDVKPNAPSMIGGGHGTLYLCRIANREVRLFQEGGEKRWFVEK